MSRSSPSIFRSALLGVVLAAGVRADWRLHWDSLPALPPAAGQTRQPGVASPFAGTHGGVLLVAGGANFPERMPWEGGAKVWWDDIWVLERRPEGGHRWAAERTFKLSRPIGYGVSVSTAAGVVCAGGSDAERCYAEVFLLAWDASARALRQTPLPPLPRPLANMAGALAGSTLYVAGGQHAMKGAEPTRVFWALDLSRQGNPGEFRWQELPPWPGPARILPIAAAIGAPGKEQIIVASGRRPTPGAATELLADAYAYEPARRTWRRLANVGGGAGRCVMAGMAAAVGPAEMLVVGGDGGALFRELEGHDLAMDRARAASGGGGAGDLERELAAKRRIYETHPGFSREVLLYDLARDRWQVIGQSPVAPQVTTLAVPWEGAIVLPSGEIRPGVRTPEIVRLRVER